MMKKTYVTTLLTITLLTGVFNGYGMDNIISTPNNGLDDDMLRQMQAMSYLDSSPNSHPHLNTATGDQGNQNVSSATVQDVGDYIQHVKADGESSLAIGVNGSSSVTVNHIVGTNEGMAIAQNQHDIIIEGEKSHIVISAASTSSPLVSNNATSKIGDLVATNGGTVIGQNSGTITITRKKKTNV